MRRLPSTLLGLICAFTLQSCAAKNVALRELEKVPGVVIDHSPASSGRYLGSPSLVILPDGNYLASHDFFGPKSGNTQSGITEIFCSTNRGTTWNRVAELHSVFWHNLFVHRGAVYLMGTTKEYGQIIIRRSEDDGRTWTGPESPATGQLTSSGHWHTAPVPVVEHAGRVWRAFENADNGTEWGRRFCAGMLSAPADADLLNATNWTFSNFLPGNPQWLDGDFGGWLEGNAVVTPAGKIVNMIRCDVHTPQERAAVVEITDDGKTATFDPATGFVDFPGGAKKFTVRFDPLSKKYWTLANVVAEKDRSNLPGAVRNTLALASSSDLIHWQLCHEVLHHEQPEKFGFQYADWQFDGEDIIAVCRTAFDDQTGGAHNYHDANFITFHRFENFRRFAPVNKAGVERSASAVVPLWRDGPVESKNLLLPEQIEDRGQPEFPDRRHRNITNPEIEFFRAEKPNGSGVIIMPGGGYWYVVIDKEGRNVARWFNSIGVNAFVLKYRLPNTTTNRFGSEIPLQDAQRALRLVRSRANEFGVQPDRIGAIGFSAGGHLASTLGTHFDAGDSTATDFVDRVSCRPDFLMLGYPVISMDETITHGGSRNELLGKNPSVDLIRRFSNELQVVTNMPPVFLFSATDDTTVKVDNSLRFYAAARAAGVPAELHLYEQGGHGFGIRANIRAGTNWTIICESWLRSHGWLKAKSPS